LDNQRKKNVSLQVPFSLNLFTSSEKPGIEMEDLKERIKWLTIVRVSLMTLLFGATLLFQIGTVNSPLSLYFPSVLLGYIYFLTLGYFFLLNRMKNLVHLSFVQLSIDVFIETLLVMFTGSVESPFSFLYILSIISGALLLNRLGSLFVASLAFILYGAVVDLEYFKWGIFGYFSPTNLTEREVFYSFFLYLIIFFTVAVMSGFLSEKLYRTRKALDERDRGLQSLRAFHENVVRSMGSGLLTTDLNGKILTFNAAAESITGFSRAEVIEMDWWKVFGWSTMPISHEQWDMKFGTIRFDKEGKKKNASRLLIGMTLSALKNDEGEQRGFVGTFQDLTKIKEMEESIRLKERLAHLGEMAAGIAHEIRNPLASLSGSMEVLKQELNLKGHQQKLMEIALKEAERLNHLISDFLNYARPRSPVRKLTVLKSFVEEEIFLFQNSGTSSQGIRIELNMDPHLPTVLLDQELIKQVFWNLLLNASEAMPEGGIITISSGIESSKTDDPTWYLSFEDNGTGIPNESIGKIFNPFYSTKDHGTGLGLSIVHRIVEEHGGKIAVSSRCGEGTEFVLRFPVSQEGRFILVDRVKESVSG
jgi:two-component system sensor histidine kinase PilS (NtrC family)